MFRDRRRAIGYTSIAALALIIGSLSYGIGAQASGPEDAEGLKTSAPVKLSEDELKVSRQNAIDAAQVANANDQLKVMESGGEVTYHETLTALLDTLNCAKAAGLKIDPPRPDWSGAGLQYSASYPATGRDEASGKTLNLGLFDDCYNQHARYIDMAYQLSQANVRYETTVSMARCIAADGGDVTTDDPLPILMAHTSPGDHCLSDAQRLPDADLLDVASDLHSAQFLSGSSSYDAVLAALHDASTVTDPGTVCVDLSAAAGSAADLEGDGIYLMQSLIDIDIRSRGCN